MWFAAFSEPANKVCCFYSLNYVSQEDLEEIKPKKWNKIQPSPIKPSPTFCFLSVPLVPEQGKFGYTWGMCLSAGSRLTAMHDVYNNHQELLTINIKPLAQLLGAEKAVSVAPHPKKEPGRWSSCRIGVGCFTPISKCLFAGYFDITTKLTIMQIKSKAVSASHGDALLFITQPKQIPPPAACIQQLAFMKCWWQRCLYQLCDAPDCRCELDHQQRQFLQAAFPFFLKDVADF